MSYLYRCTRGYNVYPYPFLGVSYKPEVTLEQILQQNFGDPIPQSVDAAQPQPYFASRFGSIEDNTEMTTNSAEITIILQNSPETTTVKNQQQNSKIPSILANRLGEVETNEIKQIEAAEATTTTVSTTLSTTTTTAAVGNHSCLEIGAKVK